MLRATSLFFLCLGLTVPLSGRAARADDFESFVKPLLARRCAKCHGRDEANAEIDFGKVSSNEQFLKQPHLIEQMIEVISANDMPPEGEPELGAVTRNKLLATLKASLRSATAGETNKRPGIRRLNRFQYNNAVRDLFRLNRDVFSLPEKLMTRRDNYVTSKRKMPDRVNVASLSLRPAPGLSGVRAFPKDLRASHGFDNQANQLTLSPLLLDAFLRLSVSVVESPDFDEQTVGIWNEFFKEPSTDANKKKEIRNRLARFLRLAFRGPIEESTLDRYSAYVSAKLDQGVSWKDAMKKVTSAALSSPKFLYRSSSGDAADAQFELASNLSFFLWASGPDEALLSLAAKGELAKAEVLNATVERMFADLKIERFLDTFPSQWMQLENVLAATPDPQKYRHFSFDKSYPASLQMLVEPLLLFDAVFVEDRPIVELISPEFSYQSEFLKTWYNSDLKPPVVDTQKIVEQNRQNDARRKELAAAIQKSQGELAALIDPVKKKILEARQSDEAKKEPLDLKPFAAWEFDGNLKDSVGSLDLTPHGKIDYENGMVVLKGAYLLSKKLPFELKAKSLEVWFTIPNLDQRGGGLMGIQGPGDFFDTIVIGERKPRHWISGSNGFSRTLDFPESTPEDETNQLLHLVMVYQDDGTTMLYRNGKPYGKPFRKGQATFPKNNTSVIFGLRHLPAGGNKHLTVSIDKARFYNRALSEVEVQAAFSGENTFITEPQLLAALTEDQRSKRASTLKNIRDSEAALSKVPANQDPRKLQQDSQQNFDNAMRNKLRAPTFQRVAATDARYGGVITNAAVMSMTSGPKRTHPIARGAWIIEVIFNDPPPPPPNDVPPLNEEQTSKKLTIREKFAQHRENPDCAGCHSRLDPLGFAMENFDITGRWRDRYENGRDVDSAGRLMRKHNFGGVVDFKNALVKEERRFAKAFTAHLLRFALARELGPADSLTVESIVDESAAESHRLRALIKAVVLSEAFCGSPE